MIIINDNTFHLQGKNISYIMIVNDNRDLLHYYFGRKLKNRDYAADQEKWSAGWNFGSDGLTLDASPQEYPAYGHVDLRNPAYVIKNTAGNTVSHMKYCGYKLVENAMSEIEGMPSLFMGDKHAQTLEIIMADECINVEIILSYTVFNEYDVILRNTKIINKASSEVIIDTAYSANLDLPKGNYDLINFAGGWARERELCRNSIVQGTKTDISNARGHSGHNANPFIMIAERCATENYGEVYGLSLVYSGNHSSMVECDQFGNTRVQQGINPFQFSWKLKPGEEFCTPQCVLSYSKNGIGGISRELHDVFRSNLCRSKWANKNRPIVINNWEATYFDFDEEKLVDIAKQAAKLGIEMFVLDDGWFGKRNDDKSGLGDWFVNEDKIPSGLNGLSKRINDLGIGFGIWIEPEMVSPDSELYRNHPDWAINVPGRYPTQIRNQFVLDLSRSEVCEYIIKSISNVLSEANIAYVKWDMNRAITDMPYEGYNHKYTLGFYKIMDAITGAFPDILFEGCCSGGGRFDAGVLAYMPQIWTSDNSDAIARLKIQYSTSIGYPVSAISAHVTASPNHLNGRVTSLKTRADVAYAGIFGYELDITEMTPEELDETKEQIKLNKKLRQLMREGDFYRLLSPYETNYCSWEMISKDKSEVFVFACKILATVNTKDERIKLIGLDENEEYTEAETGKIYGGDELMYYGIKVEYGNSDFSTMIKRFRKTKSKE